MGFVDGLKDGAVLTALGVIAWIIVKKPKLTLFGEQDYYPNGTWDDGKNFNPDKKIGLGSEGQEVIELKKLLNKYCYTITASSGIDCCPSKQSVLQNQSGGYYWQNQLMDETDDYFDQIDATILFNRTGADNVSYRELVNAIKGLTPNGNQAYNSDGTKKPNNWGNFLREC